MVKQDNSILAERIFSLEEYLREAEEQSHEALKEGKKKNNELVEKMERESGIANDNFNIRYEGSAV